VAESALCEVPTLRSDAEGAHDQIVDGVTGYLFRNADGFDAFRYRLKVLLLAELESRQIRKSLLREVGSRARTHFLECCGWGQFSEGCESLFGLNEAR
jgi:glycosyltransferase involved in cell wall biosynthesis